mmetsp:Transcript_48884/g.104355  ORF Transcript_48884/g.104355 Transcript_48884/m.104355 type:complete len:217 (+) Transcript_48884:574-1224(+)
MRRAGGAWLLHAHQVRRERETVATGYLQLLRQVSCDVRHQLQASKGCCSPYILGGNCGLRLSALAPAVCATVDRLALALGTDRRRMPLALGGGGGIGLGTLSVCIAYDVDAEPDTAWRRGAHAVPPSAFSGRVANECSSRKMWGTKRADESEPRLHKELVLAVCILARKQHLVAPLDPRGFGHHEALALPGTQLSRAAVWLRPDGNMRQKHREAAL